MRPEDYPAQEPFNDLARRYAEEVARRGAGVTGHEASFGDDPYQSLIVYPAAEPSGDVLIFQHGGGWTNGYKEWQAFIAPALNALGVTLVSAGYRLAPTHVFPAAVDDTARAIAWTSANIGAYGGRPDRLFVGGHSAGGHHAAWVAVSRGWQSAYGLPDEVIRGCLPVSGVFLFGPDTGAPMRPRFLGAAGAMVEVLASPLRIIQGLCPPFLIAYGTSDLAYLPGQAEALRIALEASGTEVEMLVLDGCNHLEASYACGDVDGPWPRRAAEWMAAH